MSFVAPLFLAGLAALALPWVLHRFSDEQPEVRPFPSDRFLEAVPPPVSRTRRLRHRALLALRIAALALLCLLFAGPLLERLPLGGAPAELRLLAIDASWSMRADERFERARDALAERLRALPPEGEVVLVAFDDRVRTLTDEDGSAAEALDALAALEPGHARADYGSLMRRLDALAAGRDVPVAATVATDAQASALPVRPNELLAPRLDSLEIVRVDGAAGEDGDGDGNAGDGASLVNARLDATATSVDGVSARVALRLSAGGAAGTGADPDDAALARTVRVSHRGETLASLEVRLPPTGTLERVVEPVTLPPVDGEPVFDVGFDAPDALPGDDAQRVPVRAIEPVALALGGVGTRVPPAAATYLETAFDTDGRARVETLAAGDERVPDGVPHAVLFVGADDPEALARVVRTAERGIDVLAVLLPGSARPGERRDAHLDEAAEVAGAPIGRVDEAHPLALGDVDWFDVRFFSPAAIEPVDGDETLLADADGRALLVERPVRGDARLLLLADPLDGEASELPFAPAFVDLASATLDWFTASGALPERVRVGEGVPLPPNVQVLDPDGDALLGLADGASASLFAPRAPGLYRVVDGRGERPLVVVVDERESDLAPMAPAALEAWGARHAVPDPAADASPDPGEVDAVPDAPGARAAAASEAASQAGREAARRWHWLVLLPLAALLLFGETLVANRRLDVRRDG